MDLVLKHKIETALQHFTNIEIINTGDFYFQKAKDALQEFFELEVSEESKSFLLTNRRQYNELKQHFEDNSDLSVFGKLILSVITYCDANAHKKQELNEYDDKRVLALAFVRMNHWVEQLITYKFEGQLPEGSVKNAIEYLLYPRENFTMLSENHRNQISQNLFKKPYNRGTFKEDFFNYFSEFSISVKNIDNYTHLLTRLCYSKEIEKLWKDNIIGLVCPDTTGWQQNAIRDTASGNYIALWNHKKPNGTGSTLKLLRQCIDENGFFRIFYTASYNVIYVAEIVDFVSNQNELEKVKWPENFGRVEWYNTNFADYKDGTKLASWIYLARKIDKVNSVDYQDFNYYKDYGYPSVGCQAPVISYKTSCEINFRKQMDRSIDLLKYKKQIILQGPPGTGKTKLAKGIARDLIANNNKFEIEYSTESQMLDIVIDDLKSVFIKGDILPSSNKNSSYEVIEINDNGIVIRSEKRKVDDTITFQTLFDCIRNPEMYPLGTGLNSQNKAAANFALTKLPNRMNVIQQQQKKQLTERDFYNQYCKLIQFHPSFTYEDFVRGIVAKPNKQGTGVLYESENKILGDFASKAISNPTAIYVLIIDEINRANLSSVLGELIYALEYRGEAVESMYSIEDESKNKLVLPTNLYIIGTMNTADRSVGHIDYAIRRRFAFVDVPAENLKVTQGLETFDSDLFDAVAALFDTNLSPEFEKKDVQLGHSYFIDKSGEKDGATMTIRLKYEIKPILREYVRDGVLSGEKIKEKIEALAPFI